jgi:hypothetical protein
MNRISALTVVYRGQLDIERSRVDFIISAMLGLADQVDFVHLSPGIGSGEAELLEFTKRHARVRHSTFISASTRRTFAARRELRRSLRPDASTVVVVGFSAWPFAIGNDCLAWFINGIPEERLLTRRDLRSKLAVRLGWWGARMARPRTIIVVSKPMLTLVRSRLGCDSVVVVPNAVDGQTYHALDQERQFLTYQGGGSPWQGLDRLAEVWGALHLLDPTLRFRVISRDERTRVLGRALPPEAIDFASAQDADGVNRLLAESRLGFLFRPNDVVNAVSWPMKYGEYLSAGAAVVVTDCGWDLQHHVVEHGAGIVVQWDAPAERTAAIILNYLTSPEGLSEAGVQHAALSLESGRWERVLIEALTESAMKELK